ncbi:MAG: hypothetical protein FWG84_07035, partial [Bacteroidales bacterium]|nr:hypothetical protein [Bacteroidales bacterium]
MLYLCTFKTKYIEWLRQYYYVGGMPAAVVSFSEKKDFVEVRAIQKKILDAYESDFSKHAPIEIDLLVQYSNEVIPVEVKAAENLKTKSLKTFCQKYKPETARVYDKLSSPRLFFPICPIIGYKQFIVNNFFLCCAKIVQLLLFLRLFSKLDKMDKSEIKASILASISEKLDLWLGKAETIE